MAAAEAERNRCGPPETFSSPRAHAHGGTVANAKNGRLARQRQHAVYPSLLRTEQQRAPGARAWLLPATSTQTADRLRAGPAAPSRGLVELTSAGGWRWAGPAPRPAIPAAARAAWMPWLIRPGRDSERGPAETRREARPRLGELGAARRRSSVTGAPAGGLPGPVPARQRMNRSRSSSHDSDSSYAPSRTPGPARAARSATR